MNFWVVTDKNRISVKDKGNPDICTVSKYHEAFNQGEHENIYEMCRNANIGCVACKNLLSERINFLLEPFREKRAYYEEHKMNFFILTKAPKAVVEFLQKFVDAVPVDSAFGLITRQLVIECQRNKILL